jgi:dTMP kinase
MTGLFITFEGGEGAGKSTLIRRMHTELTKSRQVILTREPGGTSLGEDLRACLLHRHEVTSRAELFLFLAARVQHVEEVIKPAIAHDKIVLCDRFSDSTIAYQGAGRGLGVDYVTQCAELATLGFHPHITFFINIDPEVGLRRVSRRRTSDRIEKEELAFHLRVHEAFLTLAKAHPERIVVLDGTRDREGLFQQAMESMRERIT